MEFCSNCGAGLEEGAKFCVKCGAKVEAAGAGGNAKQETPQYAYPPRSQGKNGWQYFVDALTKYAVFTGRARRSEYWFFVLFYVIFIIAATIIQRVLLVLIYKFIAATQFPDPFSIIAFVIGVINASMYVIMVNVVFCIPGIAVCIRRMHDIGKSGWFILIPIYNIVLAATEGVRGPNQYGQDPKES